MLPYILPGTITLASALPYICYMPKEGDIVIALEPSMQKKIIKRIGRITGGSYYLNGDNKNASTDSKDFGLVSRDAILAKVIYISKPKTSAPK